MAGEMMEWEDVVGMAAVVSTVWECMMIRL
jgi:hypothetical protein